MLKRLVFCCCLILPHMVHAELLDPTRPPDYMGNVTNQVTLEVSAIVYSVQRKIAVINGEAVTEQQSVQGNRVTDINANSVQLEGPNGRIVLDLVKQPVKK